MKVGIIGSGHLGSALVVGFLKSSALEPKEIVVSDILEKNLRRVARLGVDVTTDNKKLVKGCNVVFIAVKPDVVGQVLEEVFDFSKGKLFVSVAAGVSTKFIESRTKARVVRAMPNICAAVAEMASAFSTGRRATKKDEELVKKLLDELGLTFKVKEALMDAVTGLSGSGPAFIYLLIGALSDAGVELGLAEDVALKLAAQTAKGAAEVLLSSGESLDKLVRSICTPKGTTIEGVKVFDERKVAEAVKDAVKAAAKRARELSR